MRCLALADVLRQRGARSHFLSRDLPSILRAMATVNGHVVSLLRPRRGSVAADELAHASWLGTSQQTDAEETIAALGGEGAQWLIIDHYALDARWQLALRQYVAKIMVIDDLADRLHDCDVLLDQNLYDDMQARYRSRVPPRCRLLLGPKYALLRQEFRKARESMRTRDGTVRRILVLMGGIDTDRLTLRAIEAVAQLPRSLDIDVVISSQNRARGEVAEACKRYGYALHVQPPNLASLMEAADVSVGAAGSTTWERCCLGLPTICVTEAMNQLPIAKALHSAGAAINLGDKTRVRASDLAASLASLIHRADKLASMSLSASKLVDGAGADRVTDVLWESA